ncbi:MAG: carboxypeptidase-like regulatory domain-containing protein [Bacteroidales bacterium]|jgi:hypothetical protein
MKNLLSGIFFLLIYTASGQDFIEINGRLVDSSNSKPLSFGQISLNHTGFGTNSNDDGNFRLDITRANLNDTLLFFYLGYETLQVPVKSCLGPSVEINMKPITLQLAEVEVVGLTPQEVIRKAVMAIPSNYGKDSLILTAFIRSQKSVNNRLAEYTEAVINDLKTGYYLYKSGEADKKHRQSNIPLLLKGRVNSDTNKVNALGDIGRNVGCLSCNFTNDVVEFYHHTILDESLFHYYDFSMEELLQPGGGKIYHIQFDQKKDVKQRLWKGDLYIEASSFAIMKLSQKPSMNAYDAYEKNKYNQGYFILNKSGWIEEMPFIQQTINYSKKDSIWVLSSIRTENWMVFTYPPNGQRLRFNYKNDVIITEVTRAHEKIKNFKGDKVVGTAQRWDQIIGRPDDTFWASFNYLPVEEALKRAVENIGK